MSRTNFDLIAVGTGPAASTVAKKIADAGKRVATIESREFGGTCALRGCNPKKVYTNAGDLMDRLHGAEGKLIQVNHSRINWQQLLAFKREFTQPVIENSENSFRKRGIDTFHGEASFAGPNAIRVNGRELTAERIFIGVGAHPRPLDFPGGELVISSDQFMEMADLPGRVAFIGGGYVSMEFACVAARHGSQVAVLQSGDRILTGFDPDLVQQLADYSATSGVDIKTNAEVQKIERTGEQSLRIEYGKTPSASAEADLAVHGAGRVPNLSGLNLPAADVEFGDHGIEVNALMQSVSNPAVYAAGDCAATKEPMLTPTANEQARAVVKNLFSQKPTETPDYGAIPQVAFTIPPIASIGMSQTQAEQSHQVDVRHEDISSWGSVRKSCQRCAGYKVLVDKNSDLILGAHLLGPAADETINLFALAMKFRLTATNLKSTLFAFPTHASDVRQML